MHLVRKELFKRCMHNSEFTCQILGIFIESTPKTVQSIRETLTHNLEDAKRHAHSLKGSAGNLSMPMLRALAIEIEALMFTNDTAAALQKMASLESELVHCLAEAEQYRIELMRLAKPEQGAETT